MRKGGHSVSARARSGRVKKDVDGGVASVKTDEVDMIVDGDNGHGMYLSRVCQ